ncbi:hypothetical protein HDF26_000196 [Pedobacter cryoconitis]|uniref:hypothetical protein n=1 Tax=Pedobacter cryoconitis TaxID=188932 RepID=UPI001620958C|nr:hypothetical protein [Pedobacter cryoconitis]MBB6269769.1 hypothetical protein [Pedobacter cryoconitis]
MLTTAIKKKEITLKRFLRKNLLYYIIPNVVFNTIIPYFSFTDLNAVHLFAGEQNLARFILPMAFFLPFIITFDILKKTITLSEKGHSEIVLSEGAKKKKFIFQMAGINGFCTVSFVFALMLGLHFGFPEWYDYNGTVLSVLLGLTAGIFSVLFTYLPIKKLKKHHLPYLKEEHVNQIKEGQLPDQYKEDQHASRPLLLKD